MFKLINLFLLFNFLVRNQRNVFTISPTATPANPNDELPTYEEVVKSQDPPAYHEVVNEANASQENRKYWRIREEFHGW